MLNPEPQILVHTVLLSLCLLTCNAGSSYYITAPQYIIPGENTTLAVHWFGVQHSEINVTAGIAIGFNVLVQAYKVFRNDSIGLLTIPADPNTNIVQQWLQMKSDLGVVSSYFSLTSNPTMGNWMIEAKSDRNVFSSYFSVTDYILPKFIVTLDAPQVYVSPKMLNLTGTVTARYYSNKPVEGNVTVTVTPNYVQNASIVVETSTYIMVTNSEYKINFIEQHQAFMTGGNFTSMIQIQRTDKQSLTEQERKEKVIVNITYNAMTFQQLYAIPETGIITVQFLVNLSSSVIYIMAQYKNMNSYYSTDEVFTYNPLVQLKTPDSTLKAGIPFEVHVDVLVEVQQIYYTVVSKGMVVAAGKNGTTFSLTPENAWAPTAELLVSSLKSTFALTVPDINTTWVANAFIISENLGLGLVEEPAELSIFKSFVVELKMPYSVTRGEQFILEVTLKNYLKENLQVLVTMESNTAFNIIVPFNNNNKTSTPMVAGQQKVIVPGEDGTTVLFPIEPKKLGNLTLTVKAASKASSDVLTQSILVKAEGVKYFYTQTELFGLSALGNASQIASKNFSFSLPSDVVQGSEEAFIAVVGNPLVPSINGLESLIQMPCGCGEQNMINFAPNIYILQYLITSKKITEDIRARSIGFMNIGYQRELTYKRSDGSFSVFGNADSSGSTWLSAFVFRCFLQAREFIYISPAVLDDIAQWLVRYQDMTTGVFTEPGIVIHKELQGGLDGPVTLTAYVLTSLLEDATYRQLYDANIQRAVKYIESKFDDGISTNYTLSVVAYALTLAKSTKAEAALNKLNSMAITAGELKFWSSPSATTNYYWKPRTADIETAAYALLSFNEQSRFSDALPVLKWLTQQMSSLGGYVSTQDTIMALQALCKVFSFSAVDTALTVSITGSTVNIPKRFQITNDNLLLLQSQQIEVSNPLSVNVTVVGRGVAIVQFNVMYNRKTLSRRRRSTPVTEAFTLDVKVGDSKNNINKLSVDICTSYQGPGNESGMALLDVGFLSGFTIKTEDFIRPQSLKLVEPKEDKVYLYFDSLTKDKLCISVPMIRFAKVAGSRDAVIQVYDYYNPEMTATRTYNSLIMSQISSCNYCGSNCSLCRSNVP
ncbi:PREDICTED: CD109 antigen-like, partial [Nanorana parkeri]|uniref:CD109 antigen-like n=1 Tax=Nanorana parkeri TaxID=125878 RepID=UPI000854191B